MKYFRENKNNLNFFDSTSFLMLAVLAALSAIVFLPLAALNGKSGASQLPKDSQTIEFRQQNILYESPESPETKDCPMKLKQRDASDDYSAACQHALFNESDSEFPKDEKNGTGRRQASEESKSSNYRI